MLRLVLVAALCLGSTAVSAGITGNKIFKYCVETYDTNVSDQAFCDGYLAGIIHGTSFGVSLALTSNEIVGVEASDEEMVSSIRTTMNVCIPKGVNTAQIIDMIRKRLVEFPKDRHEDVTFIAFQTINDEFPCF